MTEPRTRLLEVTAKALTLPGVREKRGAGAGWVTPWRSTSSMKSRGV